MSIYLNNRIDISFLCYMIWGERWYFVFVDIDHHCLRFLFILTIADFPGFVWQPTTGKYANGTYNISKAELLPYKFTVVTSACKEWDPKRQSWDSSNCKVMFTVAILYKHFLWSCQRFKSHPWSFISKTYQLCFSKWIFASNLIINIIII
jgi:hypothetical protein